MPHLHKIVETAVLRRGGLHRAWALTSALRQLIAATAAVMILMAAGAIGHDATAAGSGITLEEALRLQREGRNRDAQRAVRALVPALRASGDRGALARALAALADASIAVGDYEPALVAAREAFDLHQQLGQRAEGAWDLNAVGLANLYLGRYDAALDGYRDALQIDRAGGDGDGEMTRLNNIGNVHFMRGRYTDALALYEQALGEIGTRASDRGRARLRKMTLSNLAALFQRLGANDRALELYAELPAIGPMASAEEAQLLVNQGALLRRMGDPRKALETYGRAQALFGGAQHRDGEIGAWRNIGIVYALDLEEPERALDAFAEALRLARGSANVRGEVQARLYMGEALRRLGRGAEAMRELEAARDRAADAGLVEERWKALFSVGRTLETTGQPVEARRSYEEAIAAFESLRANLRTTLRSEFLADKRDVYDALIALRLSQSDVSASDLFELIERSRARVWQERADLGMPGSLHDLQQRLAPEVLLVDYWIGPGASAALWVTSTASGIVRLPAGDSDARAIERLTAAIADGDAAWRRASVEAGRWLLSRLPDLRTVSHLLVVPDGILHSVPFEALTVPGGRQLIVERLGVSYLPSARWLLRASAAEATAWRLPWQRGLVAFGDPSVRGTDPVRPGRPIAPLPYAREEVEAVAALLPGRADVRLGADARKDVVTGGRLNLAPVLHFSTHAIADQRNPETSRVLLASASGLAPDYLFLREIYDLDLRGVTLVTMSACSTERGPLVRGEGIGGFGAALLAAGAAGAVTTLWDVSDRASAELMKQFYFNLSRGESEAAALRAAKRAFLASNGAWAHPRYWAGYVLTGGGRERLPRVIPWRAFIAPPAVALVAAIGYRLRRRRLTASSRSAAPALPSTPARRTAGGRFRSAWMR